jgi:hypothetical protein
MFGSNSIWAILSILFFLFGLCYGVWYMNELAKSRKRKEQLKHIYQLLKEGNEKAEKELLIYLRENQILKPQEE